MSTLAIAHRGASRLAPENTLAAIEKAVELKAGMVALDVQRTRDNKLVLLADSLLERTTNGSGRVQRMSWAEVAELDAGSWFGEAFDGTRVPLLSAALECVGSRAQIMLILPEMRDGSPLLAELNEALGKRARQSGDVLVFADSDSLVAVRKAHPDYAYALTLDERVDGWLYLGKAEKLGLKVIRPHKSQADGVLVGQARSKGLKVYVGPADDADDIKALQELRVDGIISGRPDRVNPA